jgi:hypothetical protein
MPTSRENQRLITYHQTGPVKLKCVIRLDGLFPDQKSRARFEDKWSDFVADSCNSDIYHLQGSTLSFDSEQLIPSNNNAKPSLLLVLGNPASESVKRGMFFATDKDGKELRFWKHIIEKAKILPPLPDKNLSAKEINYGRKKQLWNLDYQTAFRIGLTVFISMPSAAGGKWGGVAGIIKLLGAKAFKIIEKEEIERIVTSAQKFIQNHGAVITFQKNAWENLRSKDDPAYTIDRAKKGKLTGNLKGHSDIRLYGVPPTRLVGPCRKILIRVKNAINEQFVLSS